VDSRGDRGACEAAQQITDWQHSTLEGTRVDRNSVDPVGVPTHPELLEQGQPFRQWKTWRIPGTELTLTGYSRANDKTFFHVPELRCALDEGLCEGRQPEMASLVVV
jgi:hypothetical protein